MTERGDRNLVFSRVLADPGAALVETLDRSFTGRARLTPQASLLLDDAEAATVAFDAGVPTHARYDDGRRGPEAVAALATAGPTLVELYATDDPHPLGDRCRVRPTTPATNLADDAMVERTRAVAPADADGTDGGDGLAAVEAFLADEEAIESLQSRAREDAERRAAEWGFNADADAPPE